MSEGDASSWKEEFFETAEQTASQNGGTLDLGTYKDLITKITADFFPYDAPKDVIYEMKEMRMGSNTSIEEHVSKFKMLVTRSKLEKNNEVIEYYTMDPTIGEFQWSLPQFNWYNIISFPVECHQVTNISPDVWMNLPCQQQVKTWLIS